MAKANEAIPSVRVKCFLVPPTSTGRPALPIGLVEQIGLDARYRSELFTTVGDPHPVDGVVNFEDGAVNFGAVYEDNPDVLKVIVPAIDDFTRYEKFSILTVDPNDNAPITMAVGCLPERLQFRVDGGRAARLSYSGMAEVILRGAEITKAMGQ